MKKSHLLIILASMLVPLGAQAKSDYIFKQHNNPANYVRLEKLKDKGVKANHPYNFDEILMADLMRSIRFNRKALFSDTIKTRNVFEEEYIEKYAPLIVKAFKEADAEQAVFVSMVQKRPYFIIRNDRLSQIRLWVVGQELHMDFVKIEAKLQGDYQANTQAGKKQIEDAEALRVSLEPQEGQKFSVDSTNEIILDLNQDWNAIVAKIEAEEARLKEEQALRKKPQEKKQDLSTAKSVPASTLSPKDQKTAEDRLTELKKLKDKGLISPEDYEKKKQEILQGI